MSERGYFGIGVYEPKFKENIGTLIRSAACFGAAWTFQIGGEKGLYRAASNTTRAERHTPHYEYQDAEHWLHGCPVERRIIAIETGAESLPISSFVHPERAVYLLGREDTGLPAELLALCDAHVSIPTKQCLNVAVAGSIVLYDRITKRAAE